MFSKPSDAPSDRQPDAPPVKRVAVPSLLAGDLVIEGNLEGEGDIQIDGRVTGDVKGRTLTVSERGSVAGAVSAKEVRLSGRLDGKVTADKVTVAKTAKVKADIAQKDLTVEPGADLEGRISYLG